MQKKTLIQRLIDRYNKYQYNRPKYTINNLYCGQLKLYTETHNDDIYEYNKQTIKDFAIFYKCANGQLIHINSNTVVKRADEPFGPNTYLASNLTSFEEVYGKGFPFLGLTSKSKISKAFISDLENNSKQNQQLGA